MVRLVIWDAIVPIMTSFNDNPILHIMIMSSPSWYRSVLKITKDASYLVLAVKLWSAFCAYSEENMMTSSNGNIFRVNGPLCGEFTGHRWIARTKANDAELWCFLLSAPWINGWVNIREAGNVRRHRVNYDVIVMLSYYNTLRPYNVMYTY